MTPRYAFLIAALVLTALATQPALAQSPSFTTAPLTARATSGSTATNDVSALRVGQVLTQSATPQIVSFNSVACNSGGLHTESSYYRLFDLGALGIAGDFRISNVQIGVELAFGSNGSQPVELRLSTLSGAFELANLTLLGTVATEVLDQELTLLDISVPQLSVPAGSMLVVEIFTPNGQAEGNSFFIGSNPDGQTAPSYIRAPACTVAEPVETAAVGFPGMHIVMNVTGTSQPLLACTQDAPLSFDFDGNGTPTTVAADDFNTTGTNTPFGEFAGIRHESVLGPAVDLSACSFVAFDPFTERVTYSTATTGSVDADGTYVLATQDGDQAFGEADALFDNPGAFALVVGAPAVGAPVANVLGSVVAAVVYDSNQHVFASLGGGATQSDMGAFLQAMARIANPTVVTEEGVSDAFALTVLPNPVAGRGVVSFELASAGAVRIMLHDALGREVATLAEGPFGAGVHTVSLATASLPTGVYVVRAELGDEAQTVRLTVVR